MNIAFLYEHPTWSDALIDAFAARKFELTPVNVASLSFSADLADCPVFDVAINRINIMPSAERKPQVVFQTLHYLNWLELAGTRVINGARAHFIGASKAMQNGIFSQLGLSCPQSIALYRVEDALAAAEQIGYPLIVKPNIGGSGSGVAKYDSVSELELAVKTHALDFGVDRTGVVQEYIESDGFVYRVEVLGDEKFYSIRQAIQEGSFNYCVADGCSSGPEVDGQDGEFDFCAIGGEHRIQVFEPDEKVTSNAIELVRACGADFGGVEFLIDKRTGTPCYYDFNPYSNFVTNGEVLLGFSPEDRFIDFVADIVATHRSADERCAALEAASILHI